MHYAAMLGIVVVQLRKGLVMDKAVFEPALARPLVPEFVDGVVAHGALYEATFLLEGVFRFHSG